MPESIDTIAIIGGGPAGAALAIYLARAGRKVAVLTTPKQPPLIVGESLVPGVIPFLRELGVEEEIRDYSTFKPGATFGLGPGDELSFIFEEVPGAVTPYAYNVPREKLDATLLAAAKAAGAGVIEQHAELERVGDTDRVKLSDATLASLGGFFSEHPDLVVDAAGRGRLLPQLLDLEHETPGRFDMALFTHVEGHEVPRTGHVYSDLLDHGWSWRIPLPHALSVGLVMDADVLGPFGETPEERFDNYCAQDSVIQSWEGGFRRIAPVLQYGKYQLVSKRAFGEGWVLLGDSFGFVDPIFSSGILLALDSAQELAGAILGGTQRAFQDYERHATRHLNNWHEAIDYFYDGSLFAGIKRGMEMEDGPIGKLIGRHVRGHVPRVIMGETTNSSWSMGIVRLLCKEGVGHKGPSPYQVR